MALKGGLVLLLLAQNVIATDDCPSSYTAQAGLGFKTYCKQDLPYGDTECPQDNGCDIDYVANVKNMTACMEACATYHSGRCYAVSYKPSKGDCWLKGNSTDSTILSKSGDWNSAIADISQIGKQVDVKCPVSTNAKLNTTTGMPFTVTCGQTFTTGSYCSSPGPPCVYHADSLPECLDHCAAARPLCQGVSWNADMNGGYANCYLLKSPGNLKSSSLDLVVHSAKLVDDALKHMNVSVPTSLNYTTGNGAFFNITENDSRKGATNFTSVHADNIGQCMDGCAFNDKNCTGVLFDNVIANGFLNCHLLNSTGSANKGANVTFAMRSKAAVEATPTPSQTEAANTPAPSNKSWIAGPVFAVAAVGAIAAAVFLILRRRQQNSRVRTSSYGKLITGDEEAMEEDGSHPFEPVHVSHAKDSYRLSVLEDRQELPASGSLRRPR